MWYLHWQVREGEGTGNPGQGRTSPLHTDGLTKAQKSKDLPQVPQQDQHPGLRDNDSTCPCHFPASAAPFPPLSSVWPSAYADPATQNSLLELSGPGKLLPVLQTILSAPRTQSSRPGGRAGPTSAVPARAASAAAENPASGQQPGLTHGEWRDRKAWLSPCVRSLSHGKGPRIWVGLGLQARTPGACSALGETWWRGSDSRVWS